VLVGAALEVQITRHGRVRQTPGQMEQQWGYQVEARWGAEMRPLWQAQTLVPWRWVELERLERPEQPVVGAERELCLLPDGEQ